MGIKSAAKETINWAKRPIAAAAVIAVVALPFAARGEPAAPACDAPFSMIRFANPLVHVAQRLKSGEPITIVAIGSSYGCFAKGLGTAIAEAAQRPVVSAKAMPHLVR